MSVYTRVVISFILAWSLVLMVISLYQITKLLLSVVSIEAVTFVLFMCLLTWIIFCNIGGGSEDE